MTLMVQVKINLKFKKIKKTRPPIQMFPALFSFQRCCTTHGVYCKVTAFILS